MAIKKTLYEVLQVSRTASSEVITSAYDARVRQLGASGAPEVLTEKAVLREAHAILCDPVRRQLYDNKLREDALRALASGTNMPEPARAATLAPASGSSTSALGWMIGIAALSMVALGGAVTYSSNKRAAEEARLEEARLVEQKRVQQEAEQRARENAEWAKAQQEQSRKDQEMRRWEMQRERDRSMSNYQYSRDRDYEARQKAAAEQRAAYERQRVEQENLRRSQMELQRQQRYLQELERDRAMRF